MKAMRRRKEKWVQTERYTVRNVLIINELRKGFFHRAKGLLSSRDMAPFIARKEPYRNGVSVTSQRQGYKSR